MSDLISRKWLIDAIRNRRTYLSYEDAKDVIDLINNAPTVEINQSDIWWNGYNTGKVIGEHERPQGYNITVFSEGVDEETLEDIKKELKKVLDKLKERNDG